MNFGSIFKVDLVNKTNSLISGTSLINLKDLSKKFSKNTKQNSLYNRASKKQIHTPGFFQDRDLLIQNSFTDIKSKISTKDHANSSKLPFEGIGSSFTQKAKDSRGSGPKTIIEKIRDMKKLITGKDDQLVESQDEIKIHKLKIEELRSSSSLKSRKKGTIDNKLNANS